MKKIKKDLVSKASKIKKKNTTGDKQSKVQDLASKAKNLPENLKRVSAGKKPSRKLGEKSKLPISLKLKK